MSDDPANRVLLTVSGRIPDDLDGAIARGERPRADYLELAAGLGADLLARPAEGARDRARRLVVRVVGENVAMAWACWRRRKRYDVILTDGEQIGLPLALLLSVLGRRSIKHVMIVHVMSASKKARLFRVLHLGRGIDGYIVYAAAQAQFIRSALQVDDARIARCPFMVDTRFFQPSAAADDRSAATARPMIATAGLEFRDYPTLLRAVRDVDADVAVGAASPWSKRTSGIDGVEIPPNVHVSRYTLAELRALYRSCAFVVMPLQPVDFQAGITTILEAMSMSLAIVCTRTAGQTDTIEDGETGIYVPPGDPGALREAIVGLLGDGARRDRLGAAARAWAVQHAELDRYVEHVTAIVDGYRPLGRR